jgi:FkbM family methyltransferase
LAALTANVGAFADVVHAACTYETEPLALLNSVADNCISTGGSRVIPASDLPAKEVLQDDCLAYWPDRRSLPTVTLEELMDRFGLHRIDVLKLDCEGSEYSILSQCRDATLNCTGIVLGEYHGSARFRKLLADRFADWQCRVGPPDRYGNDGGPFWLVNPQVVRR